jgi:hypothetical protein
LCRLRVSPATDKDVRDSLPRLFLLTPGMVTTGTHRWFYAYDVICHDRPQASMIDTMQIEGNSVPPLDVYFY